MQNMNSTELVNKSIIEASIKSLKKIVQIHKINVPTVAVIPKRMRMTTIAWLFILPPFTVIQTTKANTMLLIEKIIRLIFSGKKSIVPTQNVIKIQNSRIETLLLTFPDRVCETTIHVP